MTAAELLAFIRDNREELVSIIAEAAARARTQPDYKDLEAMKLVEHQRQAAIRAEEGRKEYQRREAEKLAAQQAELEAKQAEIKARQPGRVKIKVAGAAETGSGWQLPPL